MDRDIRLALLGDHEAAKLTHLSLFSGIGGLDLAAEMAGFRTVGQCEWADYPTKVLEKHWPDVPRWRDIRTLTGESFHEKTGLRTVDVISGGFPCQPFSVAGIVNMALDQVYADLENEGYAVQAFIIPACAVDAPHRRDRCAILAHAESVGLQREWSGGVQIGGTRPEKAQPERRGDVLSDANNGSRSLRGNRELPAVEEAGGSRANYGGRTPEYVAGEWWPAEPNVRRVANGVPHRVDRLKCLGNAVVPQQFYPIFQAIADIERGIVHE